MTIKTYLTTTSGVGGHEHVTGTDVTGNKRAIDSVGYMQNPNGVWEPPRAGGTIAAISTTTPLGAGGVYTSSVVATAGYCSFRLVLLATQASATNGVTVVFYNDLAGSIVKYTSSFTWAGAIVGTTFSGAIHGPYMRVIYTNGATPQVTFRLDVLFCQFLALATSSGNSVLPGITEALYVRPVNDRITNVSGRTRIEQFTENAALGAGTTIYTVTAGKTLYVTSFIVTAVNTAAAVGRFVIQDGVDTTDRIPFIMTSNPAGLAPGQLMIGQTLVNDPKVFTSDVRLVGLAGTITASVSFKGYEE